MSEVKPTVEQKMFGDPIKDTSPQALRELLEKNLKWSHIIYEQNRRLHSKLLWGLIANWLRLVLVAVPIILGIWFFPSFLRKIKAEASNYGHTTTSSAVGVDELLEKMDERTGWRSFLK